MFGVFAYAIALLISFIYKPLKRTIENYKKHGDATSIKTITAISTIVQILILTVILGIEELLFILLSFFVALLANYMGLIFLFDHRKEQ